MKYAVLALILVSALWLGLTDPDNKQRDPVPPGLVVAHSSHCAGCHGHDLSGEALVDAAGNDVNIYDDWSISMMGLSSRDPFWRATLNHEVDLFPGKQQEIETTCLKCHAPLGSHQQSYEGSEYSYAEMLTDSLGLDGVSCSACHQQPPETYGRFNSGNIELNTDRLLYGPHPKPFEGPMKLYVGFTPIYTDLIYSSGVCAGCHTLITGTLDEDGTPTGDMFVEQATYHEWLNSSYALQGQECQNCHMPFVEDSIFIASGQQGLQKRSPFGMHQFHGANTAMLTLMQEFRAEIGLSDTIPQSAWDESIQNNRASLRRAAEVDILSHTVLGDTLYVEVSISNKAGHKMPSGYPSRVAWLQIFLIDALSGDTIYRNGEMDTDGHIAGRNLPYEPHHRVAYSETDVQIYEMAMSDVHGNLTTRLNAAYQPLKDNRLLPTGFTRNHSTYDTVAIWGEALGDPDYDAFSAMGRDVIEYRIALNGKTGFADLQVALQYHTFPSRWMQDMFENNDVPEVNQFETMYQGYKTFTELIDREILEDVELETSGVSEEADGDVLIYPNPVMNNYLQIESKASSPYSFELYNAAGLCVQTGFVSNELKLKIDLTEGIYFLSLTDENGIRLVKKIIII